MMAGNPSWWSMHNTAHDLRSSTAAIAHESAAAVAPNLLLISQTQYPPNSDLFPLHEYLSSSSSSSKSPPSSSPSSSSSFLPLTSHLPHHQHHANAQDFPHSWSQLLLGGMPSEQEESHGANVFQSTRAPSNGLVDVKQEVSSQRNNNSSRNNDSDNNSNYLDCYNHEEHEAEVSNGVAIPANWSQNMPISSSRSCVTSLSNNSSMLDFCTTNKRSPQVETTHHHAEHPSSECNSSANGGPPKKPRVQCSPTPPLKVRKEKLGDRITALHQLVSPFGKTDTASVLLEAIGYIRFLQAQIQALSSPYLGNNNALIKSQHSDNKDARKDLRSWGLCLVPISCTHLVGSDNGADHWAQIQSLGGRL